MSVTPEIPASRQSSLLFIVKCHEQVLLVFMICTPTRTESGKQDPIVSGSKFFLIGVHCIQINVPATPETTFTTRTMNQTAVRRQPIAILSSVTANPVLARPFTTVAMVRLISSVRVNKRSVF